MNRRSSFPPPVSFAASRTSRPPPRELSDKHVEALAVAMTVAPGVYARNRMFELLSSNGARRAKTRAGVLRGIVPQLARATTVALSTESRGTETVYVLKYVIATVRLTRVVELSAVELAVLRVIAERANVRCLPSDESDRELVAKTLARLMDIDASLHVPRLVRETSPRRFD